MSLATLPLVSWVYNFLNISSILFSLYIIVSHYKFVSFNRWQFMGLIMLRSITILKILINAIISWIMLQFINFTLVWVGSFVILSLQLKCSISLCQKAKCATPCLALIILTAPSYQPLAKVFPLR